MSKSQTKRISFFNVITDILKNEIHAFLASEPILLQSS